MTLHLTEKQLDLYLDDGLDPLERQIVQAHLATCSDCRQELAALRPLFQALEGLAILVPEGFTQNVMARLDNLEMVDERRPRSLFWPALALQGGLSLILLTFVISRYSHRLPSFQAGWFWSALEQLATALQSGSEMLHQAIAGGLEALSEVISLLLHLSPFDLTPVQVWLALTFATIAFLGGNLLLMRMLQNVFTNGNNVHSEA